MIRSFVVSLAFAVPVLAQPVIASITPNSGPHDGGTEVVIRGHGLAAGPIEDPPQTTEIYFGGKLATIMSLGTEEIHVLTPRNVAGLTDVTVIHGSPTVVRNAFAYDDPSWERRLVPIAYQKDVPGVNGSLWHVAVNGYNGGTASVRISDFFGTAIGSYSMTLSSGPYSPNPLQPGFADLDIDLGALQTPVTGGVNGLQLAITPPFEGLYWAVLSITNNDTQEVTTMTVH